MSENLRSPSRRSLLRALGFAPLSMLGLALSPDEESDIDSVVSQAGLRPADQEKLTRVASTLFTYLKKGAGPVEILTPEVVAKAYEKSGPFVIRNLSGWPDDGDDVATNSCAALCGHRARLLAEARGQSEASAADFEQAWEETRDSQAEVMSRARKTLSSELGVDRTTRLGFGC
jgi:hypothetical protein